MGKNKFSVLIKVLIALFFMFLSGCGESAKSGSKHEKVSVKEAGKVVFSLEGVDNCPVFTFSNEHFRKKFSFAAVQGRGSVFFETAGGKTWLKGEPDKVIKRDDCVKSVWERGEKKVYLTARKAGDDFIVKFSSSGGAEVLKWGFNLNAADEEYFTGLFERVVDGDQKESWKPGLEEAMNLRGQKVRMLVRPTLSLYCPFYVSSSNYGLFVRGTWPGSFDICSEYENIVQVEFEGPELDMTIYSGANPGEIIRKHALAVGPTLLPPKWAFGHWRWRDNHSHLDKYYNGSDVDAPYNSMVVEDILMMDALDIPSTVYWLDRPWAVGEIGFDEYEWDRERFPRIEGMVKWLEREGKMTLLWIGPWVRGRIGDYALSKGYNLEWERSRDKKLVLMDFTNPDARRWWQKECLGKVLDIGIRGFKLDRAEEIVPGSRDIMTFDGRTARENRNDYAVQYARTVNEICSEYYGDEFIVMPRAGYTGSSRYAVFWGGDTGPSFPGLRSAVIAAQRCAVMGFPFWGSDTGGYGGPGKIDAELQQRWLGFSCFCPIMEVGPTRDRAYWDTGQQDGYDVELIATWRLYAKLHTAMMDYSYDCAKEAQETGMPVIRPLFMVYPEQQQAWEHWQSYLYGGDILVSPVTGRDVKAQRVYLPAGEKWIDAWNRDDVYTGGRYVQAATPGYKIPVFVRQGSGVDLGDLKGLYNQSIEIAKKRPDIKELEKNMIFN